MGHDIYCNESVKDYIVCLHDLFDLWPQGSLLTPHLWHCSSLFFSKTIQVKVIDDEEYEKNKNFYLELAEPRMVDMSLQKGTNTKTLYSHSVAFLSLSFHLIFSHGQIWGHMTITRFFFVLHCFHGVFHGWQWVLLWYRIDYTVNTNNECLIHFKLFWNYVLDHLPGAACWL